MTVLGISLAVSVIGGLITGIIINIPFLTRYVSSFSLPPSPLINTTLFTRWNSIYIMTIKTTITIKIIPPHPHDPRQHDA